MQDALYSMSHGQGSDPAISILKRGITSSSSKGTSVVRTVSVTYLTHCFEVVNFSHASDLE